MGVPIAMAFHGPGEMGRCCFLELGAVRLGHRGGKTWLKYVTMMAGSPKNAG